MRFNQVELTRQYRPLSRAVWRAASRGGSDAAPAALGLCRRPYILEPMTRRVTWFLVFYPTVQGQSAMGPLLYPHVLLPHAVELALAGVVFLCVVGCPNYPGLDSRNSPTIH